MKLIYDVKDKPKFGQLIVFAIQQLLAIMAATLVVPVIVGNGMSSAAALFGAGCGTLVYLAFTKMKSPVFLGSSFAFLGSMAAAFAGAISIQLGYLGLILGTIFAGLVYVIIAIIVKFAGVNWINKLMPAVVIGPTVSIIGLSLATNAIGDLLSGGNKVPEISYVAQLSDAGVWELVEQTNFVPTASPYIALLCGLVTILTVCVSSVYGKKIGKLIPFIIGIGAGYAVATVFTLIGLKTNNPELIVINFAPLTDLFVNGITIKTFLSVPEFTFLTAVKGINDISATYVISILVAYVPVAFVVFAEHIADHKNISSIIEKDLLVEPGLSRTLLGDGVGSMVGAFFGGCPNTTYGESVGCVAITKNASVYTILTAAILAILISFISPFVALVNTIPACVMGGVCMALYGFIAVSGLKMIQKVNLEDNKNLFVVSVILIAGIGGLTLSFGKVTITSIACALILGIIVNIIVNLKKTNTAE
ncbi:MAG: uracil-xanthine permease [Clostridia bacterium]|nr:uracil-xanthine permease [Clostridia bacterium]